MSKKTGTPAARRNGPLRAVGVALSLVLLVFVAFVALAVIVVPLASHSTPYTVLTSSMEPNYPPGTLVVVKPIDTDDIHVGDIVTYQLESGQKQVITHRVVAINMTPGEGTTFTTKGDNNDLADPNPVLPVQVRGAVWYAVPLIGWVNNVINGDMRSVLIPIVAVLLFGYAGFMFTSGLVTAARARRAAAAGPRRSAHIADVPVDTRPLPVLLPVGAPLGLAPLKTEPLSDDELEAFLASEEASPATGPVPTR